MHHLGQEHPGVGRDHPAGLEGELDVQPLRRLRHDLRIVARRGRLRLVEIGHAQAAPQVQPLDVQALAAQAAHQARHLLEGLGHGRKVGDLAADVAGHAHGLQPGAVRRHGVEPLGLGEGDAELVLRLARGDLGVTAGRHVRIDPEGDGRALAQAFGDPGDSGHFRLGLDIDLADAGLEREGDLGGGLADPREDDLFRRHPGGQGAADLAFGNSVGARALTGQSPEDGEIGIGLDRERDQRIDHAGGDQRLAQHRVVPLEGGGGIDIDRGPDGLRDLRQRHVLAEELAPPQLEMVHRGLA